MKKTKDIITNLINDYKKCLKILYEEKLIIKSYDLKTFDRGKFKELSWITKKMDYKNLSYDKSININKVLDNIIDNKQFLIRFYDGSVFSYQLIFKQNKIIKGNILFIKLHDRQWQDSEISWQDFQFDDDTDNILGCPICFRIDINTEKNDALHSICHFTLSNYESCRIPINRMLSISDCLNFILNNFYYKNNLITQSIKLDECITDNERKRFHIEA